MKIVGTGALAHVTRMANQLGFTLFLNPRSELYQIYEMGIDHTGTHQAASAEKPVASFRRLVEVNAFLKGVQHVVKNIKVEEKGGFGFGA